ncbi:hypothetical protein V8E55_007121 [Tylopilus felleus]
MSEDDAAYSALLAQLLSDSANSRNARVHSWIEHQYDFVLSEQPSSHSPPPSPSPSSSLGAHRGASIDRPDSPLLPRSSYDRTSSPCYDALFFPSSPDDDDFEEKERVRALRFIVQEMAHWKSKASQPHTHDKPLPAPPPSPASTSQSSSRPMRSRSSSTCISRLPSFTSTLSSDQSQPQEIPPPLPVSVIVHGEYQHDLVLRDCHIVDGYLHKRDDSFPNDHDAQHLYPTQDDKDSFQPSPTLSSFSLAYSRETSFTTPYPSSPASPTSAVFSCSPCSPENIALPASPVEEDKPFFRETLSAPLQELTPSARSSHSLSSITVSPPNTNVLPASPISDASAFKNVCVDGAPDNLRPWNSTADLQSRWSIATTASLTPSAAEPKRTDLLNPRTPPKAKKALKTPTKRTRFINLISRFSPGRTDPSSTTSSLTGDDVECESIIDSDTEDREKSKLRKSLGKKPSLASLRASFSMSRASFSSQRPPVSSPVEEVPPLPTSPTLSTMAEPGALSEVAHFLPRPTLSKKPSRSNLLHSILPPIPQSASSITTFQSASLLSISDASIPSASESRVSLASPSESRVSLLPAPSKRTSLASAAGIQPVAPTKSGSTPRSKSIFRLTAKPKSLKTPVTAGAKETATPSKLPVAGNTSLPSPTTARSRIPQAPSKFNPPAKLVNVIATQSRQAPALASPGPVSPTSKLPMPPSRIPPKVLRPILITEKSPVQSLPSPTSSRLPMPASAKGARVGTVKGFWKRQ